jgi:hypothetical protein
VAIPSKRGIKRSPEAPPDPAADAEVKAFFKRMLRQAGSDAR